MLVLHRIGRFDLAGDAIPYMNNVIRAGKAFASPPNRTGRSPVRGISPLWNGALSGALGERLAPELVAILVYKNRECIPPGDTFFKDKIVTPYLRKVLHACYMRHSAAAMATFITFSSPALSNSFVIFPVPALFTTPVTQPPLRPMEAARVRTVDDSIS